MYNSIIFWLIDDSGVGGALYLKGCRMKSNGKARKGIFFENKNRKCDMGH